MSNVAWGTTNVATDVNEESDVVPESILLSRYFPNPFNSATVIKYSLPNRSHVVIEIHNVPGQKIRTLVDRTVSAGDHEVIWHGKTDKGELVAAGVDLYRFQAGDHIETKKRLLLK